MSIETEYTLEDLKFIKFFLPKLIPEYLIKQVKRRSFSIEKFYEIMEKTISIENPDSLLYVLVDPDNAITGYLWININSLENSAFINTFSIDKKYWGQNAVKKAISFLQDLMKKLKINDWIWMTTNPRFYEKQGFKRSKDVAMEYVGGK